MGCTTARVTTGTDGGNGCRPGDSETGTIECTVPRVTVLSLSVTVLRASGSLVQNRDSIVSLERSGSGVERLSLAELPSRALRAEDHRFAVVGEVAAPAGRGG